VTDLSQEGIPIQDPKKLEQKELLDRLQKSTAELGDVRRAAERRVLEVEAKSRADLDRLRSVTADHAKGLREENAALVKSLVRLQADVDALREENAILKGRLQAATAVAPSTVPFPGKGV
jgi:chromosome segregation ATPase